MDSLEFDENVVGEELLRTIFNREQYVMCIKKLFELYVKYFDELYFMRANYHGIGMQFHTVTNDVGSCNYENVNKINNIIQKRKRVISVIKYLKNNENKIGNNKEEDVLIIDI